VPVPLVVVVADDVPRAPAADSMAFTVASGRVVEIDVMNDPARLAEIDLSLIP
jgi:hypothetical protein